MYFTPGDRLRSCSAIRRRKEQIAEWRAARDLDKPFLEQFGKYIWGIVAHGDFGISYKTGKNVTSSLLERFPTTFVLATATCAIAMLLGVLLGILAANHQGTWVDNICAFFGMAGVSMPIFWLGLLMILWFAVGLKMVSVSGWYGPRYLVLPR